MNSIQKGLICLIKSAIIKENCSLPENFKLEDASIIIRKHSIAPLIYVGAIQCGIPKENAFMKELFQLYGKNIVINERQMYEVERIYDAFRKSKIDYMPVKGCKLKKMYPSPELRIMGDADILIKVEQYSKIQEIMKRLGFRFLSEGNYDYVWESVNLHVELHHSLTTIYNKEYEEYFGNGWKLATKCKEYRYDMSHEDEFIYLFIHYAKHYRIGGIGCRHVVDLWLYLRTYPELNLEYIQKIIKKLDILEFYNNTIRLINAWFNDGELDEKTNLMTEFIFNSGSWGTLKSNAMSRGVKALQEEESVFRGRLKIIKQAIFPPIEDLKHRYTILKKINCLLPVIWVWRWFDAIIFRRKRVKQYSQQVGIACREDILQYEKNLMEVGLDFKFKETDKR